jgi:prevent-host-death family protein
MTTTIVSSREGRERWRDLLDMTDAKVADVVIERNGKPVAAMIPYEDYEALRDALEDLRDAREAASVYSAWKQDPSRARPYSAVRADLAAEGLLDDEQEVRDTD